MPVYRLIKDDVVVNTIIIDHQYVDELLETYDRVEEVFPPEPEEIAPRLPVVPVAQFYLSFKLAELAKIKELRNSDLMLDSFFKIVDDLRTNNIDLNLSSIQEGINYAVEQLVLAGTILEEDRKARTDSILSGVLE
jgi:hypothetical protein